MKRLGFSITELTIAIAILAMLIVIGSRSYSGHIRHSHTNQNKMHAEEVIRKMSVWTTAEKKYPDSLGDLSDSGSVISTISSDTRERLTSSSNPSTPGSNNPKNIEVQFCYRPDEPDIKIGARAYYWDLVKQELKYQHYGNSEEAGAICHP